MTSLPVVSDCWNRIGVWGDRSCAELGHVVHCHNCPTFASAGRHFLDASSPAGYLEEWAQRLAPPLEEPSADQSGVLVFRLSEEWLALPVRALVEVTLPRRAHRIPHHRASRGSDAFLAGLVNIRGELYLGVHLSRLLGIRETADPARLLVVQRGGDRWVFPVDEVDQVHRLDLGDLTPVPATIGRALGRLTRGVFTLHGRATGLLDDERLFQTLRVRLGCGEGTVSQPGGPR